MNMIIYDGGSSRDEILNKYSIGNSNSFKVTSLRSQMFIVFTTDGHGVDKGFTAIISFSPSDNFCENALDLSNGKLTVHNNWPVGTYCQWLIYAVDDEHYVNLEFQNLDVRIAELDDLPGLIVLPIFLFRSHTG